MAQSFGADSGMDKLFNFQSFIDYLSHSIHPVLGIWLAVAAAIGVIVAWFVRRKPFAVFILSTYIILVLLSTVILRRDSRIDYGMENLILMPLWSYRAWVTRMSPSLLYEDLANILMMVPIGICIAEIVRKRKLYQVLIYTLLLELVIEGSQLVFQRGLCETDDVLSGLCGALIGYGVYMLGSLLIRKVKQYC